jgi:transglutaminase-like putative cysteine protease
MSWRIRVEHHTDYQYAGEVRSSYNEARITPLTTVDQLVLEATVKVTPAAKVYRYLDYWSAVVHAFDIDVPHTELSVVGRSVVETAAPRVGARFDSWETIDGPEVNDDWSELLAPTSIVTADQELAAVAADIKARHSPATAGDAIVDWVRSQLTYLPGTTGVHTSALEAWQGGKGVCQDFAHLTLAVARSMGLPGRYCSGYLHPNPDARIGETVAGQSHAWVELWAGDWQGYDPTSGVPVGERHVLVTRGRDYSDVTPLKGVFNGGPASALKVTVALTRLA